MSNQEMDQIPEKIHPSVFYNDKVESMIHRLQFLYASIAGNDSIIKTDWCNEIEEGIRRAASDMVEDAIAVVERFGNVVFDFLDDQPSPDADSLVNETANKIDAIFGELFNLAGGMEDGHVKETIQKKGYELKDLYEKLAKWRKDGKN